jgi:hypothetical protein
MKEKEKGIQPKSKTPALCISFIGWELLFLDKLPVNCLFTTTD